MSSRGRFLTFIVAFSVLVAFAFLTGCGGGSSSSSNNTIVSSGNNVASISVNAGPAGNYANGGFASITVCVPGTSTCQTVDDVLVDTGSSGLRILSSAFSLALPPQEASGNPVFECFPFESGYTWGPVQTADVEIADEKASSVPVQLVGTNTPVPDGCLDFGLPSSNTLDTLGANGILGVGLFAQDCGQYCEELQTAPGNPNLYYQCASSPCQAIGESLAQQVPNPVTLFATDNNGVIIELPAVSGGEPSLSGSLVFGIGTESNNALGGATIYTADSSGSFTTTYSGSAYSGSFIDSGSNGFFFPDTNGITECGSDESGFYCPSTTENLSASNQGVNGSSGTVKFSVADAATLFDSNDYVFNDLGGPASNYFDWGLPFFYGRNVFTGIQGATYPNGYWAY
ncbi:MAG: DUF3443 domain-containing protein [Candidatus Sulfotelmatobacter sp.]|jgi:uncharacterized protein DUF3443